MGNDDFYNSFDKYCGKLSDSFMESFPMQTSQNVAKKFQV